MFTLENTARATHFRFNKLGWPVFYRKEVDLYFILSHVGGTWQPISEPESVNSLIELSRPQSDIDALFDNAPEWATGYSSYDGRYFWTGACEYSYVGNAECSKQLYRVKGHEYYYAESDFTIIATRPQSKTIEPIKEVKEVNAVTALYAFAGWLTSMKDPITFSSNHWATPAADMVAEIIRVNNIGGECNFDNYKAPTDFIFPVSSCSGGVLGSSSIGKASEVKPVFTQEMADNKELPPIGSDFISAQGVATVLSTSECHGGVVTYTYDRCGCIGCCWNNSSWVNAIDTRTDKEKAIESLNNFNLDMCKGWQDDVIGFIKSGEFYGVKWVGK